jgi:CRP-like cAMP-binding protein
MAIENLRRVLEEHAFFQGMKPEFLELLAGCAKNVVFHADETLFREGDPADEFYLIREGRVGLHLEGPGSPISIQTCGDGDGVGWSWLVGPPPHQWHYTARAVKDVRAIAIDGVCLRKKCEQNYELGYEVLRRVAEVMAERLGATRLQLMDLYAPKS